MVRFAKFTKRTPVLEPLLNRNAVPHIVWLMKQIASFLWMNVSYWYKSWKRKNLFCFTKKTCEDKSSICYIFSLAYEIIMFTFAKMLYYLSFYKDQRIVLCGIQYWGYSGEFHFLSSSLEIRFQFSWFCLSCMSS